MKTKPMRVPLEFYDWVTNISGETSRQTGMSNNNSATMRRMAMKLPNKLTVEGLDFGWALWKRKKK